MITASVVQDWMYRGSSYTLVVQILYDGEPYPIPLTYEAVLRLSLSSTYPRSVVEKAAKFYSHNNGIVHFEFYPTDTRDLLAAAYDLTIHFEDASQVVPVLKCRFGLVDSNPEVSSK